MVNTLAKQSAILGTPICINQVCMITADDEIRLGNSRIYTLDVSIDGESQLPVGLPSNVT